MSGAGGTAARTTTAGTTAAARVLRVAAIVVGVPAALLCLASYFWGLWFLLLGLALILAERRISLGSAAFAVSFRHALSRAIMPVVGIICALIIGALIMRITGYDPISSYRALFYGGLVRNWSVSVLNATPLIFTGLAVAFAFQGGLFNIGAEGQYYIGVIAATWLGLRLSLPPGLAIPLVYIAGALAGALLNVIPALLKVKTGAHEVITTMMLAYAVRTLSPMFIRANGGDPANTTHPGATDQISEHLWLPLFKDVLPLANYRLHIGIILAIACAFLVRFILMNTTLGYRIRAVGYNPEAARTAGISVAGTMSVALLISGVLAAFSGVTQCLGLDHRMYQDLNAGYGWNGISIALLARNNPVLIIFTALLWGVLDAGGQFMARTAQTPNAIIEIVKGTVLFLLLAEAIYESLGGKLRAVFSRGRREPGPRHHEGARA